ncbi:hypothetical protein [Sphingomonas sp.]|uniref:hypothetical protein n=1 Tax=Sphingomonas sp. TaxID=28214 RepID=UPI002DD6B37D|nr:hypothetical protein [Sphingomonas sp.]
MIPRPRRRWRAALIGLGIVYAGIVGGLIAGYDVRTIIDDYRTTAWTGAAPAERPTTDDLWDAQQRPPAR